MQKKILGIFLFHMVCLGLLLIPDQYQGPVVAEVSGLQLRTADVTAFIMIIIGSLVLNILIFRHYWPQIKQLGQNSSGGVAKRND